MNPNITRVLIAVFLIAHAFIHVSLTYVPLPKPGELHTPFWPSWGRPDIDSTWPVARVLHSHNLIRGIGIVLWLVSALAFALAGLALLHVPGIEQYLRIAIITGASSSLLMLIFFWHPWYIAAVLINAVLLSAIVFQFPKFVFFQ
ncbi:MAG: hypothetical protein BGO78_06125 [Chloroflexi bacterium 44-23]|nr:MAG: hypothetical protein BGO78_06125 [Chloroflexi bacterium 44-23]